MNFSKTRLGTIWPDVNHTWLTAGQTDLIGNSSLSTTLTYFCINHGYQRVFSIWNNYISLSLSASCEYLCYGSTAIINFELFQCWNDFRVKSDVYRCQFLTSKVCSRTRRINLNGRLDPASPSTSVWPWSPLGQIKLSVDWMLSAMLGWSVALVRGLLPCIAIYCPAHNLRLSPEDSSSRSKETLPVSDPVSWVNTGPSLNQHCVSVWC